MEHEVTDFIIPGGKTQAQAKSWFAGEVHRKINSGGGTFRDSSHGGLIVFTVGSFPNVWVYQSRSMCVINASWGYRHY